MDSHEAAEILGATRRLTELTRKTRRAFWFPLTVFGALTLGSAPLYGQPPDSGMLQGFARGFFDVVSSPFAGSGHRISIYWLVALPAGYVATAWYYRRRAEHTGVAGPMRPYVFAGVALMASLFLLSGAVTRELGFVSTSFRNGYPVTTVHRPTLLAWLVVSICAFVVALVVALVRKRRTGEAGPWLPFVVPLLGVFALSIERAASQVFRIPNLLYLQGQFFRGTTPLLVIAMGLFVLAWVERSGSLAAFCVAFSALALLSNLYNVENIFYRIGIFPPAPQINVIAPGMMLLLGGVGFRVALATTRSR